MSRELPSRPHLDHLKAQAKELLRAHQQRDPQALARIRESLPSCAGLSDAAIAAADFALHDAQSVIAREYGQKSWALLRGEVAARVGEAFPEALVRALTPMQIPPALGLAIKDAWVQRSIGAEPTPGELPPSLPLLAVRNAFVVPGSILPIQIGRATSLRAIEAAMRQAEPRVAVFSQRDASREEVDLAGLHPIGCEARVTAHLPDGEKSSWIVLEGRRWILAREVRQAGDHATMGIEPFQIDRSIGADAAEVEALGRTLRERALTFARALPDAAKSIAMIEAIADPLRLADLVVGALPCPIEDKARYAKAPGLVSRLRIAAEVSAAVLGV